MEFIHQDIQQYADDLSAAEPELLQQLNRETHLKVLKPRMLSGHFQGRLLALLSKMLRPRRILEIGTYTGYSALCLAEGLVEDGKLVTIDVNEELVPIVQKYVQASPFAQKIDCRLGEASEVIATLDETWDLVFIDADKKSYKAYYEMVLPKMASGGIIIADNVLWSGKVVDLLPKSNDKDTLALKEFNLWVNNDPRVENILLPIRDGLNVIRKL